MEGLSQVIEAHFVNPEEESGVCWERLICLLTQLPDVFKLLSLAHLKPDVMSFLFKSRSCLGPFMDDLGTST